MTEFIPTTGIEAFNAQVSNLSVLPNPVSSEFRISFGLNSADEVSASLYSLDGKLAQPLMNENVSGDFSRAFNINELPAGVYLVKIQVGENSVTEKILKQ